MNNGEPPYYMGGYFMNDATWECKENQRKNLVHRNNCKREGRLMKTRILILPGEEVKLKYK